MTEMSRDGNIVLSQAFDVFFSSHRQTVILSFFKRRCPSSPGLNRVPYIKVFWLGSKGLDVQDSSKVFDIQVTLSTNTFGIKIVK